MPFDRKKLSAVWFVFLAAATWCLLFTATLALVAANSGDGGGGPDPDPLIRFAIVVSALSVVSSVSSYLLAYGPASRSPNPISATLWTAAIAWSPWWMIAVYYAVWMPTGDVNPIWLRAAAFGILFTVFAAVFARIASLKRADRIDQTPGWLYAVPVALALAFVLLAVFQESVEKHDRANDARGSATELEEPEQGREVYTHREPKSPQPTEGAPHHELAWIATFASDANELMAPELASEDLANLARAERAADLRSNLKSEHPTARLKGSVYNREKSSVAVLTFRRTQFVISYVMDPGDGSLKTETFCRGRLCGAVEPNLDGFRVNPSSYQACPPDRAKRTTCFTSEQLDDWADLPQGVEREVATLAARS